MRFLPAARARTTSLTALAAGLGVVALAACGGGDPATGPKSSSTTMEQSTGTSASASTATASSSAASGSPSSASRPKETATPGATISGAALAARMTAAELAAKFVHVTQVSTGGQPVQVDLAFTGPDSRNLILKDGNQSGMRAIGGDYWMYAADSTDGKPWMSVLKSDRSPAAIDVRKALVTGAAGYATSDPQTTFGQGKATFVGADSMGNHYRVVVAAVPVFGLLAGNVAVSDKTALTGKTVTYDVWLGADDRPAKVVLDAKAFQAVNDTSGGDTGAAPGMTVTYSAWGKPVQVTPPPASEVATVDQKMNSLGGPTSSPAAG